MSQEQYRKALRHERKREKLPRRRTCAFCGETDIRALQASDGAVLCADCRLALSGRSPFERHHPAGKRNDPFTVKMPANEHGIFNDMQNDWPPRTLMNPKRSPLLRQAGSHRAALDTLLRQVEIQREWATLKEDLEEFCRLKIGEDWCREFEMFRKEKQG